MEHVEASRSFCVWLVPAFCLTVPPSVTIHQWIWLDLASCHKQKSLFWAISYYRFILCRFYALVKRQKEVSVRVCARTRVGMWRGRLIDISLYFNIWKIHWGLESPISILSYESHADHNKYNLQYAKGEKKMTKCQHLKLNSISCAGATCTILKGNNSVTTKAKP